MGYSIRLTRSKIYIVSLGVIALLACFFWYMIYKSTAGQEMNSSIMNLSGRQRMLSQQISLLSLRIATEEDNMKIRELRRRLREAASLMEKSQDELSYGKGAPELRLPGEVQRLLWEPPILLDSRIRSFVSEARELERSGEVDIDNEHLQYILQSSADLVKSIDLTVRTYESFSERQMRTHQALLLLTFSLLILIIVLEGVFIFRPMEKRIKMETEELENRYDVERRIAEALQKGMMQTELPSINGLEVKLYYSSATRGAEVGGDFYDFFETLDKKWGIVVGDVAGKGVEVAVEATKLKYLLRDRAYNGNLPGKVLTNLNNSLIRQGFDQFVALTYCLYDPEKETLSIVNAGNPYPYHAGNDLFLEMTEAPLAVNKGEQYHTEQLRLNGGEMLIFCTDGILDARRGGEFFGEEQVRAYIKGHSNLPLRDMLAGLVDEARAFSNDNLTDDILLVAIKKL